MRILRQSPSQRIIPLVAFLALMILSLRVLHIVPVIAYASVFIAASVLYLLISRDVLKASDNNLKLILLLLLLLFAVRTSFLPSQPIGSDDVYRYMWDGRVQSAGINPYRFAPQDPSLDSLHTARLPALVNHPDLKTVYFPLSEWMFTLAYHLSEEQVWGIRVFILIAEILTIIALLYLSRELKFPPWRVLIYAASPLIILQFSLDAHVDVLGFPLLLFGLYYYMRKRTTAGLVLIGCSLLIKPTMVIILPVLFFDQRGVAHKARVTLIPLAIVLMSFVPYSFGTNPFEALTTFSKNWFFNGALFSALLPLFSDNQTARLWCLAFLAFFMILLLASKKSFLDKVVFSVLLLILCSPVAHIWYIGWLIVLLPLAPIRSGIVLAATASLPSITFVAYQLAGTWKDYPLVLLLEYVPVIVLLYSDLGGKWNVRGNIVEFQKE